MIDYYETKSQPITRVMVWEAYKVVRSNKGGSGVDGMTWSDLEKNLPGHLYKLWNRLSSGSYYPPPVMQVEIAKKGGGVRKLGIPTLLDRIAQQVVRRRQILGRRHAFGMKPTESPLIKVGQMGKGLVQICQSCVAAQEVQGKPHLIYPLEIGTTLTILVGRFTNMKSRVMGDYQARFRGNVGVKFPCVTRLWDMLI